MLSYFDPISSIRWLQVCKRFYQCIDHSLVRARVYKDILKKQQKEDISKNQQKGDISKKQQDYELCDGVHGCGALVKKKNMWRHRKNHKKDRTWQNTVTTCYITCSACDAIFGKKNYDTHECMLQVISCPPALYKSSIQKLCKDDFRLAYKLGHHQCKYQCTICGLELGLRPKAKVICMNCRAKSFLS